MLSLSLDPPRCTPRRVASQCVDSADNACTGDVSGYHCFTKTPPSIGAADAAAMAMISVADGEGFNDVLVALAALSDKVWGVKERQELSFVRA